MKHIVVLTGAGMSAESGIQTFRDADGLWENHNVQDVASPEGFRRNPEMVLRFYNERRQQLLKVQPNAAHYALAELEKAYKVTIVTQNIDDLHERGGSSSIVHLHGRTNDQDNIRYLHSKSGCHNFWYRLPEPHNIGTQLPPVRCFIAHIDVCSAIKIIFFTLYGA